MLLSYRVSELEQLRMLLGKRHRSAEDVATAFKIMLEECVEDDRSCKDCTLSFGTKTTLCCLMSKYVEQRGRKEAQ